MTPFSIFLFVALGAEIIGTIAGFGSATILVPVATAFFDIKTAIALVGFFHFFGQLIDGFLFRKYIIWKIGILFAILGVLCSFIGALLIAYVSSRLIEIGLGVFLTLYSLFSLLGKKIIFPPGNAPLILAGGLIGFIAGVFGTAGALRTAALSTLNLKKEHFLGTSFAIAFLVDLTRISVYYGSGMLTLDYYWWFSIFGVAFVGSMIGKKIVFKIPGPVFYRFIYGALFLAGVKFLIG